MTRSDEQLAALVAELDTADAAISVVKPWGVLSSNAKLSAALFALYRLAPATRNLIATTEHLQAEVARLSTPPDDAEVEDAHREWFATTYPHTYADVQSDYEALDAFITSEEAWAAATLAAHAALAAIERAAYERGVRDEHERMKNAVDASVVIGRIMGFLGEDEGRIKAFREACGPELCEKALALLTQEGR